MSGTAPVVATQLRREYRDGGGATVEALRGVDLEVAAGESLAVMGPSGSGKSTLLHLLGALDTPTSGSVRLAGEDVAALSAEQRAALRRRYVGLVFQTFELVPSMTVLENVALRDVVGGRPARGWQPDAVELLELLDLGALAERRPHELSGGQQQRVAVARAVYGRPPVVLADEPTGNLDQENGATVLDLLLSAVEEIAGACLVVVTHDAAVAARCGRVVALRDGRVVDELRTHGARADLAAEGGDPGAERVRRWLAARP
ncbi:ABC transporter ATP-binding protein [Cellulomonas sp.]|uniref:ABC transporter ATP-binding protein n=1 Tax=Cellulomonas sp. TaxID=40001 RepID=UPI00281233FD|nr:ABC transporter ATP-binding protein [Cellulomonas sp.]